MRVDLPNKHWVELRDPGAVSVRDMRSLRREYVRLGKALSENDAVSADECAEEFELQSVSILVVDWDLPGSPDQASLRVIPAELFGAISTAAAPAIAALFPRDVHL